MATTAVLECELYPSLDSDKTKTFYCSPLDVADIETMNLTVRAGIIRSARMSLDGDEDDDTRDAVLDAALRQANRMSFFSKTGQVYFQSMDGAVKILHAVLSKTDKDVTVDVVAGLLKDPRNQAEWQYAIMHATGLGGKPTPKNPPGSVSGVPSEPKKMSSPGAQSKEPAQPPNLQPAR